MKLLGSLTDTFHNNTRHNRNFVPSLSFSIKASVASEQDILNLAQLFIATQSKEPVTFIDDRSGEALQLPRYGRVILSITNLPYQLNGKNSSELVDKTVIPIILEQLDPLFTEDAKTHFSNLYGNFTHYGIKKYFQVGYVGCNYLVLSMLHDTIVSISSGIIPAYTPSNKMSTDSMMYRLFGMPTRSVNVPIQLEELTDLYNNDRSLCAPNATEYNADSTTMSKSSSRFVIGQNYIRVNSVECDNGNTSVLMHRTEFNNIASLDPLGVEKLTLVDSVIESTLANFSNMPASLDAEITRVDYRNQYHRYERGVTLNSEVASPTNTYSMYYKFTIDEVLKYRSFLNHKDLYTRVACKIPFKASMQDPKFTKKFSISPIKTEDGIELFGIALKSSAKKQTERAAYKTRIHNTIHAYLMSIAYAVTLRKDFVLQDDFFLDTLGISRIHYGPVSNMRVKSFNTVDHVVKNIPGLKFKETDLNLTFLEKFKKDFTEGKMKSSVSGGKASCITSYFYMPLVGNYHPSNQLEPIYGWLVNLDCGEGDGSGTFHTGPGLLRAFTGFSLESKSFSVFNLLSKIKSISKWVDYEQLPLTELRWNYVRNSKVLELEKPLRAARDAAYFDNFIQNQEIVDLISQPITDASIRPLWFSNTANLFELATLSQESLSILTSGYACSNLQEMFDWWLDTKPLLDGIVGETQYLPGEDALVRYLLDSTSLIVSKLSANIEVFV